MIPRNRRRRAVKDPTAAMSPEDKAAYLKAQAAQTPISEMGLPVRIVNALEEADMILCDQLLRLSRESLTALPNFGTKTLKLVTTAVEALGLEPPADWAPPPPPEPEPPPVRPKRKRRR